jgi:prevent-host-death family protein
MYNVQVRPSRDLRNKYGEISGMVKEHNPVIITNHGVGDTVLISMEDYAGYEDYMHQMFIVSELTKAEAKALEPDTKWFTHDEVFAARHKLFSEATDSVIADNMEALTELAK